MLRLGEEVGQLAGVDPCLPLVPPLEQLRPARAELALERGDEGERVRREDALPGLAGVREHFHAGRERRSHRHRLTRVGLPRAFTEAVEAALPQDAVLTEPEELRTYECDGLTGQRVIPALVVPAGDDGAGSGRRPRLRRARHPVRRARRGHRASPAARCRSPRASSSRSRG